MSRELSAEQRQELLTLLQQELRRVYEVLVANGVGEAALIETLDERRRLLQSEDR